MLCSNTMVAPCMLDGAGKSLVKPGSITPVVLLLGSKFNRLQYFLHPEIITIREM